MIFRFPCCVCTIYLYVIIAHIVLIYKLFLCRAVRRLWQYNNRHFSGYNIVNIQQYWYIMFFHASTQHHYKNTTINNKPATKIAAIPLEFHLIGVTEINSGMQYCLQQYMRGRRSVKDNSGTLCPQWIDEFFYTICIVYEVI